MFGVWTSDGSVAPSSHSGLFHCLTGKTTLTSTRSPSIMWHRAENTCRHLYIQLFWLAFEHRAALCSTKWSSVGSSPYWLNSIQHKSHSLSVANPSFPSKHRCPPLPLCHADCDVTRPKCCSHKEDNQMKSLWALKAQTAASACLFTTRCRATLFLLHTSFLQKLTITHSVMCRDSRAYEICKSLLCNSKKTISSQKIFFLPCQSCTDVWYGRTL